MEGGRIWIEREGRDVGGRYRGGLKGTWEVEESGKGGLHGEERREGGVREGRRV